MVNSDGQLYTIEGVAAALIILATVYIVIGTTSIYTAGDTHISDMQMEQLGNDVLRIMNTPNSASTGSLLQTYINNSDKEGFRETFLRYCNTTTGGAYDNLQFSADVYYRDSLSTSPQQFHFTESRNLTGGEHAVRVTKWIRLDCSAGCSSLPVNMDHRIQEVLMEVILWRG